MLERILRIYNLSPIEIRSDHLLVGNPICARDSIYSCEIANIIPGTYQTAVTLAGDDITLLSILLYREDKLTEKSLPYISLAKSDVFGFFSDTDHDNLDWLKTMQLAIFTQIVNVGTFSDGLAFWGEQTPGDLMRVNVGLSSHNEIVSVGAEVMHSGKNDVYNLPLTD